MVQTKAWEKPVRTQLFTLWCSEPALGVESNPEQPTLASGELHPGREVSPRPSLVLKVRRDLRTAVRCLGLSTSTAGGKGSILARELQILQTVECSQIPET